MLLQVGNGAVLKNQFPQWFFCFWQMMCQKLGAFRISRPLYLEVEVAEIIWFVDKSLEEMFRVKSRSQTLTHTYTVRIGVYTRRWELIDV